MAAIGPRPAPVTLPQALEVLGMALARRRGQVRDQAQVSQLLTDEARLGKRRAA